MKILALDTATVTGFAATDRSLLLDHGLWRLNKLAFGAQLALFTDRLYAACRTFLPDVLAYEQPTPSNHASGRLQMALVGLVELAGHRLKIETRSWYPAQIKKAVAGHGHAKKPDMIEAVRRHYPELPENMNHNVADAIAIAILAARVGE